jgi:hypothetical protein
MGHHWKFFRAGGFDQVRIETAEDLLNLSQLDPKLWVALACPTKGVEFDARTLALMDTDGDGFIRAPELLSAIAWAAERLSDPGALAENLEGVPLGAIREDGPAAALRVAAAGLTAEGMVSVAVASSAQSDYAARAEAAWNEAGLSAQPWAPRPKPPTGHSAPCAPSWTTGSCVAGWRPSIPAPAMRSTPLKTVSSPWQEQA